MKRTEVCWALCRRELSVSAAHQDFIPMVRGEEE